MVIDIIKIIVFLVCYITIAACALAYIEKARPNWWSMDQKLVAGTWPIFLIVWPFKKWFDFIVRLLK